MPGCRPEPAAIHASGGSTSHRVENDIGVRRAWIHGERTGGGINGARVSQGIVETVELRVVERVEGIETKIQMNGSAFAEGEGLLHGHIPIVETRGGQVVDRSSEAYITDQRGREGGIIQTIVRTGAGGAGQWVANEANSRAGAGRASDIAIEVDGSGQTGPKTDIHRGRNHRPVPELRKTRELPSGEYGASEPIVKWAEVGCQAWNRINVVELQVPGEIIAAAPPVGLSRV